MEKRVSCDEGSSAEEKDVEEGTVHDRRGRDDGSGVGNLCCFLQAVLESDDKLLEVLLLRLTGIEVDTCIHGTFVTKLPEEAELRCSGSEEAELR